MSDSLLIAAPALVLVVVLLLGFAGCGFSAPHNPEPEPPPDPVPSGTLTFRGRVPTALTVIGDGVDFTWMRPGATMEETEAVTVSTPDGADNVFQYLIPSPAAGGWSGRCAIAVQGPQGTQDPKSENKMFMLDFGTMPHSVLLFQAQGSVPTVEIVVIGLQAA